MNLKYCHFTFPPSSPSLLLSDFPLSYLSSRHHHHHHHLLHKRSLSLSLSLKHASSPLHRHLFLVPFLFIKSPIFAPTDQTRCIPSRPFLFRSRPSFHPHPPPNVSPTFSSLVFAASYRCAATSLPVAHPRVAYPRAHPLPRSMHLAAFASFSD